MKRHPFFTFIALIAMLFGISQTSAYSANKKVLLIDSYHEGYPWSDSIVAGVKKILGSKAELKIIRMETKRNNTEDFKKQAGEKVKQEIDAWKPDVVIAADDNSSKYIIVPFFKDSPLPFVFCGINWDASAYGFPYKNVTGMLEVSLLNQLLESMGKFSKGKKIGFIGKDNETDRKEADMESKKFNITLTPRFVNTFEEWKVAYKELQTLVDMLIVYNNGGITGWNDAEAKKFTREYGKIPSGSSHDYMAPYVLVDYAKLGSEQGEWAASTALEILGGKSPQDIPITENKKGQLYVNLPMASKLGVKIPLDMLKAAKVIKD
jgi:ABC-type uncharacterized transport system substrate-binding protein